MVTPRPEDSEARRAEPAGGWLGAVRPFASAGWSDCRDRWRPLLVAGLVSRVGSALLFPALYALLLRLAIVGSGQRVLTDLDLIYFVTTPVGLLGLLVLGSVAIAIGAFEVGVLLHVLSQPSATASTATAVACVLGRMNRLLRTAGRFVVATLLWVAPAGLVAAATYAGLLSNFDINYYLAEQPPAFWAAVAIAAGLGIYLVIAILKLSTDWALGLPIALFEPIAPNQVRATCRERTEPARWTVRGWIVAWVVGAGLLSTVASLTIGLTAAIVAPLWPRSLTAVAAGIGLTIVGLILVGLATNLLGSIAFAAILRRLYVRLGGVAADPAPEDEPIAERRSPLTIRRVAIALTVGVMGTTAAGLTAIGRVPVEDDVLVIGHRGSPLSAPGNTLASIRAAIDEGADWVEIDVQETADGEVVVFHDSDFMKAAGLDLKIWDATLERLGSIDLGSRFSPAFAGERVPTFAEVLQTCRGKVGVVVELKYYGHNVALEERVVEIVERERMANQTMFMSLDRPGVDRLRALRPDWRTGVLLSVAVGGTTHLDTDFLGVNAKFASRHLIHTTHQAGRDVYAWTVNDPVAMSSLISRGLDGVITDTPTTARAVLAERATMPPLSRLLVDLADRFRINALRPPTQ